MPTGLYPSLGDLSEENLCDDVVVPTTEENYQRFSIKSEVGQEGRSRWLKLPPFSDTLGHNF